MGATVLSEILHIVIFKFYTLSSHPMIIDLGREIHNFY